MTTPKSDLDYLLEALEACDPPGAYVVTLIIGSVRRAIELRNAAEDAAKDTTWRNPEVAAKRAEQEQPNSLGDVHRLTAHIDQWGQVPAASVVLATDYESLRARHEQTRAMLREAVGLLDEISHEWDAQDLEVSKRIRAFLKRVRKV